MGQIMNGPAPTENEEMIPIYINGQIGDLAIEKETVYLNSEEISYLNSTGVILSGASNDDMFTEVTELTDKIGILFALHKTDAAWNMIRNNLSEIDFEGVISTPFFQMDRTATDVYKYMYDNNVVDDQTYAYFNAMAGEFFDNDFYQSYIVNGSSTAQDILEKIFACYNGVSPYAVGMIELTEEQKAVITDSLNPCEDITDYVVGAKAAVEFNSVDMLSFMKTDNLKRKLWRSIANVIAERCDVAPDEDCVDDLVRFMLDNLEEFKTMDVQYLKFMYRIIDGITEADYKSNRKTLMKIIMSSDAFCNYPRLVIGYINSKFVNTDIHLGDDITSIDPDEYAEMLDMERSMVTYVHSQATVFVNDVTSSYIRSSAYPQVCHLVFNKVKREVLISFIEDGHQRYRVIPVNEFDAEKDLPWVVNAALDYADGHDVAVGEEGQRFMNLCNSIEEYTECALDLFHTAMIIAMYQDKE